MQVVRRKKIFIVEDESMFANLLKDYLSSNTGHDVTVFNTGEDFLDHLGEKPDVIILDSYLNSKDKQAADGLQILRKLRGSGSKAHVIMLSGQSEFNVAMRSVADGAQHYVIKDDVAFERISLLIDEK